MPPQCELLPKSTIIEIICQFNKVKSPNLEVDQTPRHMRTGFGGRKTCRERFEVHLATYQFEKKAKF